MRPSDGLPGSGISSTSYCLGQVFLWDPSRRHRFLFRLGFAVSAAFVLLRFVNGYGDPSPWQHQRTAVFTLLSFLNTTKYPPSLVFILMTLGPALFALAWLDRRTFNTENPLLVFGRVPFFYYVLHPTLAHLIAIIMNFVRYGPAPFLAARSSAHGNSGKTLSARLRLSSMGCVRSMDRSASVTVSGMSVVRPPQAAPPRLVAQLPVSTSLGSARLALCR